ncbi:hypothetical protein MUP65_00545 [Patescibacteria group bacterium]|nr:hypothetical protein [Patescibacteria group bacterium]
MKRVKEKLQYLVGASLAYLFRVGRVQAQIETMYGVEPIPMYGIEIMPPIMYGPPTSPVPSTVADLITLVLFSPLFLVFAWISFVVGLVVVLKRRKRKV